MVYLLKFAELWTGIPYRKLEIASWKNVYFGKWIIMKKKILVIDDELSIRMLLENFLSKTYEVITKNDGMEGTAERGAPRMGMPPASMQQAASAGSGAKAA